VPCLPGKPYQSMGEAPLDPLGGKLAHPVLHILQTLANDADSVNCDLWVAHHQVKQLGLTPARFDRFFYGGRIRRIAPSVRRATVPNISPAQMKRTTTWAPSLPVWKILTPPSMTA
jgi:hypothetical protein